MKLRDPLPKLALYVAGCVFVDNTDIMQSGLENDSYWDISKRLQEVL